MEDKDIVDLYWQRDEKAVSETADKYGRYCYSIAYNILSNTEDAEESVNDAYLNAWNSMPPHRPTVLSAFIGKITRFISLKKWRDKRTQKRGGGNIDHAFEELSECIPAKSAVEEELENKEIAKLIDSYLETLPVCEQSVFVCRYWYFDSISAISNQFGFSESKVKSMLHRTRKKLRSKLLEKVLLLKTDMLIDAIGEIDDDKIINAKLFTVKSKKKSFRKSIIIAVAIILCITITVPVLAATVNPIYELVYQISPGLAQMLKPVQMSCENNGIKMEVVSAAVYEMKRQSIFHWKIRQIKIE